MDLWGLESEGEPSCKCLWFCRLSPELCPAALCIYRMARLKVWSYEVFFHRGKYPQCLRVPHGKCRLLSAI